jgi:hypothetical protein
MKRIKPMVAYESGSGIAARRRQALEHASPLGGKWRFENASLDEPVGSGKAITR